jgi:hypothetical protein
LTEQYYGPASGRVGHDRHLIQENGNKISIWT